MITLSQRNLLTLVIVLVIGALASNSLAYEVEARFLSPNAMIFPVGRLLPPGALNNASEISFEDIQQIFEMRVDEDNNPDDDPDRVIFLIRLEEAGGDPIFTVSSSPFNIRNDPQFRLGNFYTNHELARIQSMGVGQGDEVNANALLPFIDGGNMREGLYILTVLLAPEGATTAEWEQYVNGGHFGISSATMRAFNPSQVTLTQPQNSSTIQTAYPVFSWRFPRNQDVNFLLELVSGDDDVDGSSALNNKNEENTYLIRTINAGRGGGELTTYSYTGTGQEKPLIIGKTYFWRVTAFPPTMFLDDANEILRDNVPSEVFSFRYGYSMPQEIELAEPTDGQALELPPTFRWVFPPLPDLRFILTVYAGEDDQSEPWAQINIQAGQFGNESRTYRYGSGFSEPDLMPGDYAWKVVAYASIDGREESLESEVYTFNYSPEIVLIGLQPSADEEIRREMPLFSWTLSNNFNPSGFVLQVVGAPENRAGEINGGMALGDESIPEFAFSSRKEVNGNMRQSLLDNPLPRGFVFYWSVWAGGQDEEWQYKSEPISFRYPLPPQPDLSLIELQQPPDQGTVNTATPTFRWNAPSIPQFYQNLVSFAIEIRDENGTVIGRSENLRSNARDWRYQGQPLELGSTYTWNVTAILEVPSFEPVRLQSDVSTFTYSSWPNESDIRITSPENNALVYTATPTFEWSFPQGWDVNFTLLISDVSGGDFSREIEINNSAARQYRYRGDALTPREYTWSVIAHVTVGQETRDFAPAMSNFTYREQVDQAPPITLNEPAANAVVESSPTFTWSMQELPNNVSYSFVVEIRPVAENVIGGGLFDVPSDARQYIYEGEVLQRGQAYTWLVRVVIERESVDLVGVSEMRTFTYSPPEKREQEEGASPAERVLAALNALPDDVLPPQIREALGRALRGSNVEAIRYNGAEITLEQLLQILQQMERVNMIQG